MTTASRCTHCINFGLLCSVADYRRYRKTQLDRRISQLDANINKLEAAISESLCAGRGIELPSAPPLSNPFPQPLAFFDIPENISQSTPSCEAATWTDRRPFAHEQEAEVGSAFLDNLSLPPFPRCLMDPGTDISTRPTCLGPLSSEDYAPRQSHYTDIFGGHSVQTFFTPFPDRHEFESLFQSFLDNFNSFILLFEPTSLLSLLEEDFSNPLSKVDRWACANVVLALGHMFSFNPSQKAGMIYRHQMGSIHVKNALYVVNELIVGPPTLWAAQALICIAIFLLGTLNNMPCNFLAASALRISYELAIEEPEYFSHGWSEELKQRQLVFWIAYCVDRDICLRFGGPLGQSDEFMDLESLPPPSWNPPNVSFNGASTGFNVLKSYCDLSVIKSQVYKHLYSAPSTHQPLPNIPNKIAMLDQKLSQWKQSVPKEYTPDIQTAPKFPRSLVAVAILNLHFSYFNCLIAIHRVAAPQTLDVNIALTQCYSYRVLSGSVPQTSETLVQHAARASIRLIEFLPGHHIFLVVYKPPSVPLYEVERHILTESRILLHYLLVASTTLSSNVSQNPRVLTRGWDMQLVGKVERFLSSLVLTDSDGGGLEELVKRSVEFRALAENAIRASQ
ncbi:hypothetical protein BJY01DRAFT_254126 [Aspergillus pseudoustus]|uniref:Xylanolytic transcriptional activator regulatory domain-containing protein n=1 Tax=Aspergillus pseudoustus TaxID=1810923 RepID=A0ABR4IVV1_9EURO